MFHHLLHPRGVLIPAAPASSRPPQVFTLPKVSAKTKFKLTAHEGCRVRKVALVSLASAGPEERVENCLACLTNLGDIHIFTVPSLRPQVHYGCIRKEDISGIASCVFTKHGQGEGPAPYRPHLFFISSWGGP